MSTRSDFDALIQRHRQLEGEIEKNRSHFLSDWNCDNPLLHRLLGSELAALPRDSHEKYVYFDADKLLLKSICGFHFQADGLSLSQSNVVAGPGSSSFLTSFAIWLARAGFTEVHYLPPLYHTFYFLLQSLGIKLTPVTTRHAYEPECSLRLPDRRSVLLLCDPVWYAGKCVPASQIASIAEWQRATGSVVFIDGSFQYMKWDREKREASATLDQALTYRLICPAKSLAVPFVRFAYMLHPANAHEELVFLYESVVGGASVSDLAFAHRAMKALSGEDGLDRVMPDYFKAVFDTLIEHELIRTAIIPDCGYFAFATPLKRASDLRMMDGSYFELDGYPGYCRVNLMAARRIYGLDV